MDRIDIETKAKAFSDKFFSELYTGGIHVESTDQKQELITIDPNRYKWHEYLLALGIFKAAGENSECRIFSISDDDMKKYSSFTPKGGGLVSFGISKTTPDVHEIKYADLYENGFKKLSYLERKNILEPYILISSLKQKESHK